MQEKEYFSFDWIKKKKNNNHVKYFLWIAITSY